MAYKKREPVANLTGNNLYTQDDFTGGHNEGMSDTLLPTNQSPEAKDIDLDKYGVLRPRKGIKQVFSEDFSYNGVKGLHGYFKSTGLKQLIFAVDDKILASSLKTDIEYTSQSDFESGVLGSYVDTEDTVGSMVIIPTDTDFTLDNEYDTTAEFETGDLTNIDTTTTADSLYIEGNNDAVAYEESTYAEFQTGELIGLVAEASGKLVLQLGGTTWETYSKNDWSEM